MVMVILERETFDDKEEYLVHDDRYPIYHMCVVIRWDDTERDFEYEICKKGDEDEYVEDGIPNPTAMRTQFVSGGESNTDNVQHPFVEPTES